MAEINVRGFGAAPICEHWHVVSCSSAFKFRDKCYHCSCSLKLRGTAQLGFAVGSPEEKVVNRLSRTLRAWVGGGMIIGTDARLKLPERHDHRDEGGELGWSGSRAVPAAVMMNCIAR